MPSRTQPQTTVPGYINRNRQKVIRATGHPSTSFRGQTIYEMECVGCKKRYGSNGCDIHTRRCPLHDSANPANRFPPPPVFCFSELCIQNAVGSSGTTGTFGNVAA